MKATWTVLFYVGVVLFTPSTNAQFIIENCVEKTTATADGIFPLRCEVKNVSTRSDFSALAFGDNASRRPSGN